MEEVVALGLQRPERAMVTHGSALYVRGILPAPPGSDVDIVLDEDDLSRLKQRPGWHTYTREYRYDDGVVVPLEYVRSEDGRIDAFPCDFLPEEYVRTGRGRLYPLDLIARHSSELDQDTKTRIWVASVLHVRASMLLTSRAKDAERIPLLDRYLENNS